MQSFSVPTSPAVVRSSKNNPVTPQRSVPRPRHSHSLFRTPITPNSPYTPLSLRSFTSSTSNGSSTLTTPNNSGDNSLSLKRLSFASPDVSTIASSARKDHSLADIADNWRSRANDSGIKLPSVHNTDSQYVDDEVSDQALSEAANTSGFIVTEEGLLPPPFLSTHRRTAAIRPRAQSHASLPPNRTIPLSPTNVRQSNRVSVASPLHARRLSSLNQSQNLQLTCTPPPNRALARQLKQKGSLTDPPQPRRREAFGVVRTPSQQNTTHHDSSLDLFDIDENDFEYEYQQPGDDYDDSFSTDLMSNNTFAFNPNFQASLSQSQYRNFNDRYAPPPPPPINHAFGDPFHATTATNMGGGHILNSFTEPVEHPFHAGQGAYLPVVAEEGTYFPFMGQAQGRSLGVYPTPAYVPVPPASVQHAAPGYGTMMAGLSAGYIISQPNGFSVGANPTFKQDTKPLVEPVSRTNGNTDKARAISPTIMKKSGCSVCLNPSPRSLAVLVPCNHPLCSGCLTSALNIVGEKDMECAVCKKSVEDFKLIVSNASTESKAGPNKDGPVQKNEHNVEDMVAHHVLKPEAATPSPPLSVNDDIDIDGMFEFGALRASTPKLQRTDAETTAPNKAIQQGDSAVLRIDNVPWDITPPQIKRWLQQPVERVHVLLDPKGKTMSHAYVEVREPATAGAILRGEARVVENGVIKTKGRGSVLGKGRRARGVTITRSSQEELLADLFPNWRGTFDGSRPSLAGLDGDRVIAALEGGLISEAELKGLLLLVREPDSHFLKVPSLPFHSLISILSKFPSDVDSRVFWNANVRDLLFDVTNAALQMLLSRNEIPKATRGDSQYTAELVTELVAVIMRCHAFTAQQVSQFMSFMEASSVPIPSTPDDERSSNSGSGPSEPLTPATRVSESKTNQTVHVEAATKGGLPRRDANGVQHFDDIAKEFGVEAQLVQALAQRLSALR